MTLSGCGCLPKIGDVVTLAKASKELIEEGKDIDALEAVEIVRALLK